MVNDWAWIEAARPHDAPQLRLAGGAGDTLIGLLAADADEVAGEVCGTTHGAHFTTPLSPPP